MTSTWLKNPLSVFCKDAEGGIVVRGGLIAEVLKMGEPPSMPVDQIFNASEHVVLPGLINTHHHFYQTLTRAFGPGLNKELFDWLKALYPIWAKLTPEMISVSTELALAELLLSGCTTTTDHHYIFPDGLERGIDLQVAAVNKLGMRALLTRGSMDLSIEDGGLPPKSVVQDIDVILSDSERLIATYHDPNPGAFIQIALAPCSPFSVTKDVMIKTADLARQKGVMLHTHLAETKDENTYCLELLGIRPLDYLEDCGWLEDRTWLAHGIHFNDDEMDRMAKTGVSVSSCPHSNMTLASGICPMCEMDDKGISVGLGVDGSASNDASNMIEEVRAAFMGQRLKYGSANVSHLDAIRWATEGSARCLNRDDIGSIAIGKQADLALFKLDELRHSGGHDPMATLVICGANKANFVMVGGNWRVEQGQIIGYDTRDLMRRHSIAAKKLVS
jgi:8-oxoguanine deaminase